MSERNENSNKTQNTKPEKEDKWEFEDYAF